MNKPSNITVSAPGRLHFGLFAVGEIVTRQFGGIGLMIQQPRTTMIASPADRFTFVGPEREACLTAARHWFDSFGIGDTLNAVSIETLPVKLETLHLPPRHSGLGSGTQIALSTATALNQFFQLPTPSIGEVSIALGRAKRSAIGSYGFVEGGFLVEQGKAAGDVIASLDFQVDFPEHWPIVLIFPNQPQGLAGEQEQAAFDQIPPTSIAQYDSMRAIVRDQIVPALVQGNYDQFSDALFDFGHFSGLYFEAVQGGAYNGPIVDGLVKHVRQFGVPATGQTSWGPCIFAIAQDQPTAEALAVDVRQTFGDDCDVQITRADNVGATVNGRANLVGRSDVINHLGR